MNRTVIKYALILGLFSVVSATLLAITHNVTAKPIARAVRLDFLAGLKSVLPEFDNEPDSDSLQIDGHTVYVAKKSGAVVGYACESVSRNGYGGDIKVIVGATPDDRIYSVAVLDHSETPGLGDKITSDAFLNKFRGHYLDKKHAVKKDGGSIDQFSGATVSPRAVTEAVNAAVSVLRKAVGGGE